MEVYKNKDLNDSEGEVWKDVVGYEGFYKISNLGRVKSLERWVDCCYECKKLIKEKIVFPCLMGRFGKEYYRIELSKYKIRQKYFIHKLIAEVFIPNPENKPHVNHISGVKTDNRIENLEWVTRKEDVAHAIRTGLTKRIGEDHPMSKLKNEDILEIRKLYHSIPNVSSNTRELMQKFNVSRFVIQRIVYGKGWKHI